MNREDYLLSSEFAKAIRWHPESVRRAIRDGRIKAVQVRTAGAEADNQ